MFSKHKKPLTSAGCTFLTRRKGELCVCLVRETSTGKYSDLGGLVELAETDARTARTAARTASREAWEESNETVIVDPQLLLECRYAEINNGAYRSFIVFCNRTGQPMVSCTAFYRSTKKNGETDRMSWFPVAQFVKEYNESKFITPVKKTESGESVIVHERALKVIATAIGRGYLGAASSSPTSAPVPSSAPPSSSSAPVASPTCALRRMTRGDRVHRNRGTVASPASTPLSSFKHSFCPSCGTKYNAPTAKFCGSCGTKRE